GSACTPGVRRESLSGVGARIFVIDTDYAVFVGARMRLMTQSPQIADSPRFPLWIVLLGASVIPLIYTPTLGTRFDFIDDGNLVSPAPLMPLGPRLDLVRQKIVANYQHLGPFRPVLWAHWEFFAELCDGEAVRWRLVRLGWSMFATGMLLAL